LFCAACRSDLPGGGTAPLPEPATARIGLVLSPDTGSLVRAALVLRDAAPLSVGAFTVQVDFDPKQLSPVDWVTASGGMLLASDSGGVMRLAGIHAEGIPATAPLAVVRFAWPGRAAAAEASLRLSVPELASPQGVSLLPGVKVERGGTWQ
jgi:hypothetical protein